MIQEKIEKLLETLGVEIYGFANLENLLPEKYNQLTTGIAFMVPLSKVVMNEITDFEPTHEYFHHYRTVNSFIDYVSLRLVMLLQSEGYDGLAVPASQSVNTDENYYEGLFQHRTNARMAGLGWIGKNGSLINPKYGPRVRLGTVLSNADLSYGQPIEVSRCGTCEACVLKCPAMVLTGQAWALDKPREAVYDPEVCSKHMSTHYKHIGRGVVCGICLKACPVGKE